MANEFIARKGLIVLNNGAKVTGSLGVQGDIDATGYNVTASNLQLLGSASIAGDITIAGNLTVGNADVDVIKFLAEVSSSILPDVNNSFDLGSNPKSWRDLYVSGTAYIDTVQATNISLDGITVLDQLTVSGSTNLGNDTNDVVTITGSVNTLGPISATSVSGSFSGSGAQITNIPNSGLDNSDVTITAGAGLNGGGTVALGDSIEVSVNSGSMLPYYSSSIFDRVSGDILINSASGVATIQPDSVVLGTDTTGDYVATITAGSGINTTGATSGETVAHTISLDTSSAHFISGSRNVITFTDTSGASGIDFTYVAGTASAVLQNSAVTVTAGSGLSGGGSVSLGSTTTVTLDTSSAHFTGGVKEKLNADGVVSSSVQVDVRNTTGIATIATTGSNTFTGVQTITNTTNSTTFADGALIVQGGVGITKDVNISGSLTVTGLLTAVSSSIQYVTSSQLNIGLSRITLNDDDLIRFAGISVVDSGSTFGTGSLLYDGLNDRWLFEVDDLNYNSALMIGGPRNSGSLGGEIGLTQYRVPVAVDQNHIDSRIESSSIRVDFPSRLTHVEAGLVVTGSVTSSVGFSGDGSQLTGIVTNLNLTGSEGGTGTVALKTQGLILSGSNGVAVTVSGQTVTISGSNATTSSIGVASFNGTNFTVTGGAVSSNNINLNNTNVTLGGTRNITLQEITQYGGSTTSDQVTLNGGAVIHGVLFTSGSNSDVDTGTEVVASVQTGSYDAAFFDYVVKKGVNYRAGTVIAVWEAGTSNVEFTDTSTNDLGNTNDIVFTVDIFTATARLKAIAATNDWYIKTAVRAL